MKRWRGLGYSSVVYLDDGTTGRRSFDLALRASSQVRQDLRNCALTANEKKICVVSDADWGVARNENLKHHIYELRGPVKEARQALVLGVQRFIVSAITRNSEGIGTHCGANRIHGACPWSRFPSDDVRVHVRFRAPLVVRSFFPERANCRGAWVLA